MARFWVTCAVDEEGCMFRPMDVKPGEYLILRALRPVTLAVSACPDDSLPGMRPEDLLVEVTRA
jgi:uncharacterized protein YcgI (DUF1989 family)